MEETKNELFNLEELEQNETSEIQITHPATGDDIPGAKIEIYGQDSATYRKHSRIAEEKFGDYARKHRGKMMPPEDRERLDRNKIIACTKSIKGLAIGEEPLTDPETAFTKFPWLYEQAVIGIMDRANFIKGSSQK